MNKEYKPTAPEEIEAFRHAAWFAARIVHDTLSKVEGYFVTKDLMRRIDEQLAKLMDKA